MMPFLGGAISPKRYKNTCDEVSYITSVCESFPRMLTVLRDQRSRAQTKECHDSTLELISQLLLHCRCQTRHNKSLEPSRMWTFLCVCLRLFGNSHVWSAYFHSLWSTSVGIVAMRLAGYNDRGPRRCTARWLQRDTVMRCSCNHTL